MCTTRSLWRPLRRLPDGHVARPQRLSGLARGPAHIPERHNVDPLHPSLRRRPTEALGSPGASRSLGLPADQQVQAGLGQVSLFGSPPPLDGVAESYAPRRTILDMLLADAAVAAGAEFRDALAVRDLLWDGDRVKGIRGRTRRATVVTEEAQIVIGADGQHSRVAQAVAAPDYRATFPLGCAYYTYWSGIELNR